MARCIVAWTIMVSLISSFFACSSLKKNIALNSANTTAKNIVLMIVDGMGYEHIKAARIYNGLIPFSYERFPCQTSVTTCSAAGSEENGMCRINSDDVTDSAAAATAIATGIKVSNGTISRGLPRQHEDIETILEIAKRQQKSTGVIATKLFTDATPAAFVSHADHRHHTEEILRDMFQDSQPNLVLGADNELHRQAARGSSIPYTMVHDVHALARLADTIAQGPSCSGGDCHFVYGGFGQHSMIPGIYEFNVGMPLESTPSTWLTTHQLPHLSQMTEAALNILSKNKNGFFLMVESSMPDMISHYNQQIDANPHSKKAVEVLIDEMLEVDTTVKVIEKFLAQHPDTLVMITADHETGGLVVINDETSCLGEQKCVPTVKWTSAKYEETETSPVKHTSVNVPLYAIGKGSEAFCTAEINNTDIAKIAIGK